MAKDGARASSPFGLSVPGRKSAGTEARPGPSGPSRIVAICITVVAVDQVTKAAASLLGRSSVVRPVTNPRFSLGLAGASPPFMVVLSAAGIAAFGTFVVRASLRGELAAWVPAFLVGGAVSNLADRLFAGAVRDFVATPQVVWNLADLAVVVGLVGYAWTRLVSARVPSAIAEGR